MSEEIQDAIEGLTLEKAQFILKAMILSGRVSEGLVRDSINLASWVAE